MKIIINKQENISVAFDILLTILISLYSLKEIQQFLTYKFKNNFI